YGRSRFHGSTGVSQRPLRRERGGRCGAFQAVGRRGGPRYHAMGNGALVRGAVCDRPARHARLAEPCARCAPYAARKRCGPAPARKLADILLSELWKAKRMTRGLITEL